RTGEDERLSPVPRRSDQRADPVVGSMAYNQPLSVAMRIVPSLAIAGLLKMSPLALNIHFGVPLAGSIARNCPIAEPMYTVPSRATTGDEYVPEPMERVHFLAPEGVTACRVSSSRK